MNEKPIERMKYYNGQRLEADDLKLEQEYHIRVRRWLNKSLYTAGIAKGLEVRPDLGKHQHVIVSPGLALDHQGREIILLEEQSVQVIGKPSTTEGQVDGNYLSIQYREETRAEESDSCTPRGNGSNKGRLAWDGPSRVRATPIISWSNAFPRENSDKIVLAQVELDANCKVRNVYSYIRRYIGPTLTTTVRQYALEGERHIDANNPGRIYFHIRGHQPNAVTLYLRAEKFSTLYYTEMGQHKHPLTISPSSIQTTGAIPPLDKNLAEYTHEHTLGLLTTQPEEGKHTDHIVTADVQRITPAGPGAWALWNRDALLNRWSHEEILNDIRGQISEGIHQHTIAEGTKTSKDGVSYDHKHMVTPTASVENSGVDDAQARSGQTEKALTYVNNLQVYIGKVVSPLRDSSIEPPVEENRTAQILSQVITAQSAVGWLDQNGKGVLGNGGSTHALVQKGTGPIRIDLISQALSFPEDQYYIELRVGGGGGRILYNLYVE